MKLNKSSNLYHRVQQSIDALCNADQAWLAQIDSATQQQIHTVLACSDFVARECQKRPQLVSQLSNLAPSQTQYETDLQLLLCQAKNDDELKRFLRQYRNIEMAKITARDCSGQDIQDSLAQVSNLADALIMAAYNTLYTWFVDKYGEPENAQPLCIIAMGKLGGRELNFSSDIDLIFAYPDKGETKGGRKSIEHQVFFTRLAQRLIQALDQVTTDGQVYRVDMRLRPFGDSGPLVMNFSAFAEYYLEQAREWERFAMVKARVINAASGYTEQLNSIIQPFVFKRYLDFTTLESLRAMKLKIFADSRRRQLSNNIKLGEGGIREAEFFVQYFQLIHGGQAVQLQNKNWQQTAKVLNQAGYITEQDYLRLHYAYLLLRKVEHCLQQINNQQTQTLPDNSDDWQRLTLFMQCDSVNVLQDNITEARQAINTLFNGLFKEEEQEQQYTHLERFKRLWIANYETQELADNLASDFSDIACEHYAVAIVTFKQKCARAHLSNRAQLLVDDLVPLLMAEALECKLGNDSALARILSILGAILGRTTYLDLLFKNANVRTQLFKFCSASPWMAEQLKQFPLLLDELLSQAYLHQVNISTEQAQTNYADELRQALLRVDQDDIEDYLNVLRQFKLCQQFRIAAADIHGSMPVEQVSDRLTALAEVILQSAIHNAYHQVCIKFGKPSHSEIDNPSEHFAAIAYGKLGGYELGYGSDLDLVFVHDTPRDAQTDGKRKIGAQQFYIKLAQRVMHILNTKTLLGELYETDLRLRPAGNSGLLCCHINGFEHYQNNDAWTWEHQALVRTRVVFGGTQIKQTFSAMRHRVLAANRDPKNLTTDVTEMRQKLYNHSKTQNNKQQFKHGQGGITDIEFISQFLVLANANKIPELTQWPDNLRIVDCALTHNIIALEVAQTLKNSYLTQRNAHHRSVLEDNPDKQLSQQLADVRAAVFAVWLATLPDYTRA